MHIVRNPHRSANALAPSAPYPSVAVDRVHKLLARCPAARETSLVDASALTNAAALWLKDERDRMNLGSFKALGAAYVIARDAAEADSDPGNNTLSGRTYVTASAGNHGLSVAAGAPIFGAKAVVFIAETVPETFADRLARRGATVCREGADYAASMTAASNAAAENGWILLSDSSWDEYTDIPLRVMEGYLAMAAETVGQCPDVPTHIFLQAGVGGLAASAAAYFRDCWGDTPLIAVVEPEAAPALQSSITAGKAVWADGPESIMGRLDCKEPSLIALNGLARDSNVFLTLSDLEVLDRLPQMTDAGLATTASGGAGLAAALHPTVCDELGVGAHSRVLCILSEADL